VSSHQGAWDSGATRDRILRGQPLADVAAELGYVDQAHTTRRSRHFLGTTSGRFARGRLTSGAGSRASNPPRRSHQRAVGRFADPGYSHRRIASAGPKHQSQPKEPAIQTSQRDAAVDTVIAGYEILMRRMASSHAPEFLEIPITMPQAKVMYLLGAAGELHMSELVAWLGVSLSTVSGLVDRLVEAGLAVRHEDPADRRQVVVGLTPAGVEFFDRFRELNAREMRELLQLLDDAELDSVRRALIALTDAAARRVASITRKDPA
jgi:DNA-binding MarR family transcriptional regulator